MLKPGARAELYLDGKAVGTVELQCSENSWYFGRFKPAEGFSEFAPVFGRWSLLMHADDDRDRMGEDALEELREAEWELARIRARLYFPERHEWRKVAMINIDAGTVEWKEY